MSRANIITIEEIHKITDNGKLVFEKEIGNFDTTKNISSPLRTGDSNPSFRIYQNNSFIWSFKDYGGNQQSGTYINFLMERYGLDFKGAIEKVCNDFNIKHVDKNYVAKTVEVKKSVKKSILMEFSDKPFSDAHKRYMDSYELDEEFLRNNDVYAVDKFAINKKIIKIPSYQYQFGYVHKDEKGKETGKVKILTLGKGVDPKNKWRTTLHNSKFWYLHQIPKDCENLWIVKSVKDANVLKKHFGFHCVATQNESAKIFLNSCESVENIGKNKIICFGADDQGTEQSIAITKAKGWIWFNTPKKDYVNFNIEDVSDYVKVFGLNSLTKLLKNKNFIK